MPSNEVVALIELDFASGHDYLSSGTGAFSQDIQVSTSNSPNGRCYVFISGGGTSAIKFGYHEVAATPNPSSFISAYRLWRCAKRINPTDVVIEEPIEVGDVVVKEDP